MVQHVVFAAQGVTLTVAQNSPYEKPGQAITELPAAPDGTVFYAGRPDGAAPPTSTVNPEDGTPVAPADAIAPVAQIELRELDASAAPIGNRITVDLHAGDPEQGTPGGFTASDPLRPERQYIKVHGTRTADNTQPMTTGFPLGTRILTEAGPQPVEGIATGDLVWTRDSGLRPALWTGRTSITALGALAPVWFPTGSIGNDRPLRLLPSHGILFDAHSPNAPFVCGPVLIPARHFLGRGGVLSAPVPRLDIYHLMFHGHHVLQTEGGLCESLHPSTAYLQGLPPELQDEVHPLLPGAAPVPHAAPVLRPFEAELALGLA